MAAVHNHSPVYAAVYPCIWDLGLVDKNDQTLVWCSINNCPECVKPIKVGPGGYSVLNHFKLYHPDSLQFVESEIKHAVRALPCNEPGQRLALSIIPTFIDGGSGERFGFWLDGAIIALTNYDVETLEGPVTLTGKITVYQYGTVVTFSTQKKDNYLNFVDVNSVQVDVAHPFLDPSDDPLEPEIQDIKIEDVKIEYDGDVSWHDCFKDYLNDKKWKRCFK